jgi:type IV pilus assembly protein PilA
MLTVLRQRLAKDDEDGFTLIELMVVVLIIAILIAIAIPTFLGAQDRARDRGAQSDLRNGLTAAKTLATDAEGKFLDGDGNVINAADLALVEGAVKFSDAAADVGSKVVVETTTGGASILLYHQSESDKYFGIQSTSGGDVTYCKGTAVTAVDDPATCDDAKW